MTQQIARRFFQPKPRLHNDAEVKTSSTVARFIRSLSPRRDPRRLIEVRTAPEQWSNALSYELIAPSLQLLGDEDALVVECRVRVQEGMLGIGVVASDQSTFVCHERAVPVGDEVRTVRLYARSPHGAQHLLFRNIAANGISTRFELLEFSAQARPGGRSFLASWSQGNPAKPELMPMVELNEAVAWAHDVWDIPFNPNRSASSAFTLAIVDTDRLASHLGAPNPLVLPSSSRGKLLTRWKMEVDDAPILEWLWRWHAPRRHLEFGTWEGFGTVLVARNSDAEIWTINLPDGEVGMDGASLYESTDAGATIGRLYREAGVSSRVHQLLVDSRQLDLGAFAGRPLDSAFIDGGHTPDVVQSDTDKALELLRPGGLCVWHDFCPDPEVLGVSLAPLGVVKAVVDNFDRWRPSFEKLFWIRNSWILAGITRK
jgi:predicted O-methyltransferase YrrM